MKRTTVVALILTFLLVSAGAFAADWPHYLGPERNGIAPDTDINKNWDENPPQELWRIEMHDEGYSGPAVADGKVFIHDHQGSKDIIRALDVNSGEEVWRYSYSGASEPNRGYTRATPTYDEGRLYTLGRLGHIHCLDAADGSVIWSMNIQEEFDGNRPKWGYSASPYIDGDTLILLPGGSSAPVVALDKKTGETQWSGGANGMAGYATPVKAQLQGMEQYVI